jgi:hypothetical protein
LEGERETPKTHSLSAARDPVDPGTGPAKVLHGHKRQPVLPEPIDKFPTDQVHQGNGPSPTSVTIHGGEFSQTSQTSRAYLLDPSNQLSMSHEAQRKRPFSDQSNEEETAKRARTLLLRAQSDHGTHLATLQAHSTNLAEPRAQASQESPGSRSTETLQVPLSQPAEISDIPFSDPEYVRVAETNEAVSDTFQNPKPLEKDTQNHIRSTSPPTEQKSARRREDLSDAELIDELNDTVEQLQNENHRLQLELQKALHGSKLPEGPPRAQLLHRVRCDCSTISQLAVFQDHPEFTDVNHVQGRLRIQQLDAYLERNTDIALLVFKNYTCSASYKSRLRLLRTGQQTTGDLANDRSAISSSEAVLIISETICKAFQYATTSEENVAFYPKIEVRTEIESPYVFYYHDRESIKETIAGMHEEYRKAISLLIGYFDESFEAEYERADRLFGEGKVSYDTIQYLFEPNRIVVKKNDDGEMLAYCTSSYLRRESSNWEIDAWSWHFDGAFWREPTQLIASFQASRDKTRDISDLKLYPLGYAHPDVGPSLRARGNEFWSCRFGKYVCYRDKDTLEVRNVGHVYLQAPLQHSHTALLTDFDTDGYEIHDRLHEQQEKQSTTATNKAATDRAATAKRIPSSGINETRHAPV